MTEKLSWCHGWPCINDPRGEGLWRREYLLHCKGCYENTMKVIQTSHACEGKSLYDKIKSERDSKNMSKSLYESITRNAALPLTGPIWG